MLISVVIPVYNIKEYLEECVASVLQQTYTNWECVLVDDGSTDGSESLCDYFAEKSKKIKVLHKINGGLSSARNEGLRNAEGDYVYFLDGDDKLTLNALENFSANVEFGKVDIVIGHMAHFYNKNEPIPFNYIVKNEWVHDKNGKSAFVEIHKHNPTFMMGVRGLYRKKFLLENQLYFNEADCWYSEDQEWTVRCFEKAETVSSNEYPDYLYREGRPGSLMNTPTVHKIESTLHVYDSWYKYCKKNSQEEFSFVLYKVLFQRYWNIYVQYYSCFVSEDFLEFCKMMDCYRYFVKNKPKKWKLGKYAIIVNLFNSKNICALLKIRKHTRW